MGITKLVHGGMEWASDHRGALASFAVGTATFIGVAAALGALPVALPALATLAIAGAASGVAGKLVEDLLERKKPGLDLVAAAALSTALTVATVGLGRVAAPHVARVLERFGVGAALRDTASAGAAGRVAAGVTKASDEVVAARSVSAAALPELVDAGAAPPLAATKTLARVLDEVPQARGPPFSSVHGPPPPWLAARFEDTLTRVAAGETAPGGDVAATRAFLHETYEHINEVNSVLDSLGARSHPIPAVLDDSTVATLPHIHDFGERVPLSRLEDLLARVEANPLKTRAGETVPVPDWLRRALADARASGEPLVDVSKLNPYVASGLGRNGAADPYSIAFHNLADHHFRGAWVDPEALTETIVDRVNAMRQVRIYRPVPMTFERIREIVLGDIEKGVIPTEGRAVLDRALAVQRALERSGVVNPYWVAEPAATGGLVGSMGGAR